MVVEEGDTVELEIEARGSPRLEFQWFHEATALIAESGPVLVLVPPRDLQFPPLFDYLNGLWIEK